MVAALPASLSEAMFHATMPERRTRYVTTRRNENAVTETLKRAFDAEDGSLGFSVKDAGLDEPLANDRETIKLELGSEIRVDTSRDIA